MQLLKFFKQNYFETGRVNLSCINLWYIGNEALQYGGQNINIYTASQFWLSLFSGVGLNAYLLWACNDL